MRADRLLALLLLLQTKGRVTAAEVAVELEVSERTARRDLESLSMAGVPVYSSQGRNGGWQLVGGARTDLTGLNAAETRALFLVAGPASSATPEVKAALRKLVRALPEPFRDDAVAASNAVVVDATAWGRPRNEGQPPPFLDPIQQAVIGGEQLVLGYVARDQTPSTRIVHPLGLAAKGPVWYLIAGTDAGQRTFRIDRVTSVEPTGDPVVRPDGFDLEAAWRQVVEHVGEQHAGIWARGRANPEIVPYLRYVLGTRLSLGPAGDDGWVEVELGGFGLRSLAAALAGFGADLDVDEPPELRRRLAEIGAELRDTYGPRPRRR